MTTPSSRNLNISAKTDAATNPRRLTTALRQVELWANSGKWTNLTYAAGWADFGFGLGLQVGQYFVDPFGFVQLRGVALFTGSLAPGTFNTVCTFPPSCNPPAQDVMLTNITNGGPTRIDIIPGVNGPSLEYYNSLGSPLVNPFVMLRQLSWPTFL